MKLWLWMVKRDECRGESSVPFLLCKWKRLEGPLVPSSHPREAELFYLWKFQECSSLRPNSSLLQGQTSQSTKPIECSAQERTLAMAAVHS